MSGERRDGADWKAHTSEDLNRARANLESLASSISGALNPAQARSLWVSYLLVEKSVALVKIGLDEENPGRFVAPKRYAIPDERQAVAFSLRHLNDAIDRFSAGDLGDSLGELRESRNYLRVLLKRVRRQRLRAAAKA